MLIIRNFQVKKIYLMLFLIIFVHAFILAKISFFPNSELFIYPYLTNNGLLPYKQILDQHFPGLMFLPINFDNLGMTTPEVARIWHITAAVLTQILVFVVTKRILKNEQKALFASLLYLFWQPFFEGWIQWLDIFLPIFLLCSFFFLLKYQDNVKDERSLIIGGLILGLGVVFKQVLLPLVGLIGIYLLITKRNLRKLAMFGISVSVPITLMLLYLFSIGVLGDFWYWTVVYNLTVFAEHGTKSIPSFSHLARALFVFLPAAFTVIWFNKNENIRLAGIFLLGSLASVMARFDFIHLQPSLPFVVLLTSYGIIKIKSKYKIVFLAIYLLVFLYWGVDFYKAHWSGRIWFFDEHTYRVATEIDRQTEDGEKIFLYGSPAHLYQMTKTMPAGDVFIFQFPWFMLVAEERVLEGIKKDLPDLVVADRTVTIQGQKLIDYTPKINAYVENNYELDKMVGENVEILIRK